MSTLKGGKLGLLVVALFGLVSARSLDASIVDELLAQGREAQKAENYQQAIEDYQKAAKADPLSSEPARALALLYASQGLNRLALPAWEDVLAKTPEDQEAWMQVAETHGLLNEDNQAVAVYEKALKRFPKNLELAQSMAWMLFKTEDFPRGIALLEQLQATEGTTAGIEMVLGTLYSSQFDEAQARVHYLQSIALTTGASSTARGFRSIAWYNLSLLDKDFYHFDASAEDLAHSLEEQERSSNHLALGELQQNALKEPEARRSFEKALETDDTPLSLFDLAKLEQTFGHLDQAMARARQVAEFRDESWIFNFGVTRDKFLRDQEELAADIHHSAWLLLDFRARVTPWDWLLWLFDKVREGLQWFYHDQQWKNLLVKTGKVSLEVKNSPEAWVNLTFAHREIPSIGLKYLSLSRQHELPRNPLSRPSYLVEEGLIANDPSLLTRALSLLQVPGENSDRARALTKLARLQRERGDQSLSRRSLSELFLLAPGFLPAEGLALPVESSWMGSDKAELEAWKNTERDFAWQSGWDLAGQTRPGVSYNLDFQVFSSNAGTKSPPQVFWNLRDATGTIVKTGHLDYEPEKRMATLANIYLRLHTSER